MQRRAEKLAKRAGRTPESAREEDLVYLWLVIFASVTVGLGAIVVVLTELQGGPGPEREAYPTMLILVPSVIPFGIALRHLHRMKVLQERQRRRDGVVGAGGFVERAIYDHPSQTTVVIIVICLLISAIYLYVRGD